MSITIAYFGGHSFLLRLVSARVSIAASDFKEAHLVLVGRSQKLSKRFVNRRVGEGEETPCMYSARRNYEVRGYFHTVAWDQPRTP